MPTYTFAKVEHRVTKSVKCDACGKRLKRSTTLFQTLSPFNKTPDGQLKTREQIHEELLVGEQEWRAEREWCSPCFDATHLHAKDLTAGDVLETEHGDVPVTSVDVVKNAPGYSDTIRINTGTAFETHFSSHDRVVIKPDTTP
jgi:hypothetical protein